MAASTHSIDLAYLELIDAEFIDVVFNGVEYKGLPRQVHSLSFGTAYGYGSEGVIEGAVPLDGAPFFIVSAEDHQGVTNSLYVTQAGTYDLSVTIPSTQTVTTTPCFEEAVNKVVGGGTTSEVISITYTSDNKMQLDKTFAEIWAMSNNGKKLLYASREDVGLDGETIYTLCPITVISPASDDQGGMLIPLLTRPNGTVQGTVFAALSDDGYPTQES